MNYNIVNLISGLPGDSLRGSSQERQCGDDQETHPQWSQCEPHQPGNQKTNLTTEQKADVYASLLQSNMQVQLYVVTCSHSFHHAGWLDGTKTSQFL